MTDANGTGKPAPHCPVCGTEMTPTTERRDGDEVKVWVCPQADQHRPPPHWWEGISAP